MGRSRDGSEHGDGGKGDGSGGNQRDGEVSEGDALVSWHFQHVCGNQDNADQRSQLRQDSRRDVVGSERFYPSLTDVLLTGVN